MNFDESLLRLYAITDRKWSGEKTIFEQVEIAVKNGVTILQLREKDLPQKDFIKLAKELREITFRHKVPFIINDSIDVALSCDADGIHVGQSDMSANNVRDIIGKNKIVGVSAATPQEAIIAEAMGADYLGVGAVFSTSTKSDAKRVSYEELREICSSVSIPVVAIGGINESNVLKLKSSGISGIAVVSAIFAQKEISAATKRLKLLADEVADKEQGELMS